MSQIDDNSVVYIEPAVAPGAIWEPCLGPDGQAFVSRQTDLAEADGLRLVAEAQSVLSVCQPPRENGVRTVLVVGRVQSGKTLSFEMLTALARDNGYGLVVIIAGISKFLEKQTRRRLSTDIGFGSDPQAFEKWLLISSAQLLHQIRGQLRSWLAE